MEILRRSIIKKKKKVSRKVIRDLSRRLRFWFDRNRERERERCHARLSGIVSRVARFTRVFHMGRRAARTAVRWLSGFRSVTYVRQCTLQSATSPRDPVLQWFPAEFDIERFAYRYIWAIYLYSISLES